MRKNSADLFAELEKAEDKVFELKRRLVASGKLSSYDKIQGLVKVTVDQMHEGVQIIDREWRYVYLNEAAIKHARKPREELLGKTMQDCYPGIQNSHFFEVLQHSMNSREIKSVENYFEYPDKTRCWYELHIEPHVHGILIRSLDITERKKIEENYFQAQKLQALGRLAGSVAHDFNNKLGIMQLFCEMAIENGKKDSVAQKSNLEDILSAIAQAAAISRQLLAFSRKQVFHMQIIGLNEQIEKFADSMRKVFADKVKINLNLAKDLGLVRADSSQLDLVMLNLCMNAREAMPDGGNITLTTKNILLTESDCSKTSELTPGPYVVLEITDTGRGIPPDMLEKIFDPFYTTKLIDVGTGLGLATVYGIIHQCQGTVKVNSKVGVGTTFQMFLPQAFGEISDPISHKKTLKSVAGKRVLIVEDDSLLQKAFVSALKKIECIAVAVDGVSAAKEAWAKNTGQFDLLLTDIMLEKGTGLEIAHELKAANPKLKVIFISGYAKSELMMSGDLFADCKFLQKPVSIPDFLRTINMVLES